MTFEQDLLKKTYKLREFLITREGIIDFDVDQVLEIIADVSGLTS